MAADLLGELKVQIVGDTKQFDTSMNTAEKRTKAASASLKKFGARMSKFAAAGIVAVGAASVKFASDLGESVNAVNVVFGKSSSIIQDWGDTAAEQAGLSKSAFNESSALIGTLLKKTGKDFDNVALDTIEVTKRAADLASVFNKDLSVATTAVGAALRGETEPIRAFAIDVSAAAVEAEALSSGMVKNKADITEAVKVQARYNLILKQSTNVAGDFQKTSGDLANSTRVLKAELENSGAELGQVFLPVAAKVVGVLRDLTVSLRDQAPIIKDTLISAWISFGAGVETIITKIQGVGASYINGFKTLWITSVNTVQIAFNDLGIAITDNVLGAVSKLLKVVSRIPIVGEKFAVASKSVDGLKNSLLESTQAAKDQNAASIKAAEDEAQAIKDATTKKLESIQQEKDAKLNAIAEGRALAEAEKAQAEIDRQETLLKVQEQEQALTDTKLAINEEYRQKLFEISASEHERLEAEKQVAIERAQAEGKSIHEIEKFFSKKKAALDKKAQENSIKAFAKTANTISGLVQDLQTIELNAITTREQNKIAALDREALGEEEYAKQVTAIEKESAQESWKIQKEQLAAQKAASLIQIATNTAIGVSQALAQGGVLGIATGALVAAAGAVQAGVVLSQPDPPRPQLNTGAIVKGSNAGVPVTVGENRYDELIMSRSPKGEGIMDGFADALSNKMGGGQPLVVNINTTFGLQSDEEKLEAAEQIYDAIIETGQRRGVS